MLNNLEIEKSVRIFKVARNLLLSWDRKSWVRSRSTIRMGEPIEMWYDHRAVLAIPMPTEQGTAFVLFEELTRANKEAVRQLFPNHSLLKVH